MKRLLVGPWVGEFGHELFRWQAHARRLAKGYDEVVVASRSGHEYLYQDFCTEYIRFGDNLVETDMHFCNDEVNLPTAIQQKIQQGYDWLQPRPLTPAEVAKQEFIQYGEEDPNAARYVTIHARATEKNNTGYRNWPEEKWNFLVKQLFSKGYNVACIGSIGGAYKIEDTNDLRGRAVSDVCKHLRNSKLIIGPSSGPMHLATLCGCPQLVWTDNRKQGAVGTTNRDRYEALWNPFATKVQVLDKDDWQPDVLKVLHFVEEFE